jgi:hypothetical protein
VKRWYNTDGIAKQRLERMNMTWEIAVGMFGIISAFIAVMNIVVKVNSTLLKLESAVVQLKATMEHQSDKNAHFYTELSEHEKRISVLEREWGAKI